MTPRATHSSLSTRMVGPSRAAAAAIALLVVSLTGACRGSGAATLKDLDGVQALQARFDADAGKPRVVLLLSPT